MRGIADDGVTFVRRRAINFAREKRRISLTLSDEDSQVSGAFIQPYQCIGSERRSDGF
jgi:hypothetical protein